MPLDTSWMTWVLLLTIVVWLLITQTLRAQVRKEPLESVPVPAVDIDCERFPDQCPCTTELGKGIA